ncbi:MAG: hypothetical protein JWP87_1026 [Labilithrix sp.]|nr:hypothetical protein [Labilithrix sp.]
MADRHSDVELSRSHVDVHDACTAVGDLSDAVLDALRRADRAERSSQRPTLPAPDDDTSYAFVPADAEIVYQPMPTPVPSLAPVPPPVAPSASSSTRERTRAVMAAIGFCVFAYFAVVALWLVGRLLFGL